MSRHGSQFRNVLEREASRRPLQYFFDGAQQAMPNQRTVTYYQPAHTPAPTVYNQWQYEAVRSYNISQDGDVSLSRFFRVMGEVNAQNRVLNLGNTIDGITFGFCLASVLYLIYATCKKAHAGINRKRRLFLLSYLLLLLFLSSNYLLSSISSRLDHIFRFLTVDSIHDSLGKSIDFTYHHWKPFVHGVPLPWSANFVLVDALIAYILFLCWRDDGIVLGLTAGLLVCRLTAEFFKLDIIMPLLFDSSAAGLILARWIVDRSKTTPVDHQNTTPHITPSPAHLTAVEGYAFVRLFEAFCILSGRSYGQDIWMNTVLFLSAFIAQSIVIGYWVDGGAMTPHHKQTGVLPPEAQDREERIGDAASVVSSRSSRTFPISE